MESVPSLRKTLFCIALTAIALLWTGGGQLLIGKPPVPLPNLVTPVTPVAFMRYCEDGKDAEWAKVLDGYPDRRFQGRIFTPDNLGDYPIWIQGKSAPVMVYSHVQYFPPSHWDDFLSMLTAKPGWEELFRQYRINMVWIDPTLQTDLADALRDQAEEWLIHIDDTQPSEKPNRSPFKRFVAVRKKPLGGNEP